MLFANLLLLLLFLIHLSEQVSIYSVEVILLSGVEAGVARVAEILHELGLGHVVEVFLRQVVCVFAGQNLIAMVIIPGSLIRVAQGGVCLADVLEFLSGVHVLVLIRVPLECCFLVTFFDFLLSGCAFHLEELVETGFRCFLFHVCGIISRCSVI